MKLRGFLAAGVFIVAAAESSAATIVNDNGSVQVGVSAAVAFLTDSDNVDPATGQAFVTLGSTPSPSYSVNAIAQSGLDLLPDATGLRLDATAYVTLSRSASEPPANGFAATEPGREIDFTLEAGRYRVTYTLIGTAVVSGELPGNNSFARGSVSLRNQAEGSLLLDIREFGPDIAGYSVSESIFIDVENDDILTLNLDNAAEGFIGGTETDAVVDAFASVEIVLVPEPASLLGVLLGGVAVLVPRRGSRRV
ncbi:MAG: PEP-CTERM sorting domain-containing protein [Planctomycetota bacterium]